MITLNVDLGQIIIASLLAIVGFVIKLSVDRLYQTLDRHDRLIVRILAHLGLDGGE